MKKTLFIIITTAFVSSCGSSKIEKEGIADEKFTLCSDLKYDRLITEFYPNEGKTILKKNIHSLFENFLLKQGYLTEISKAGYEDLLEKVKRGEVSEKSTEQFRKELDFDPSLLFPSSTFMSCYTMLIEEFKLVNEKGWHSQFRDAYWKFEANGDLDSNNSNQIEKALQLIPEEKFKEIEYRKLFLDLIYMHVR
ncbi:hypothetical protein SAMN04488034_11713 [Salinimicrobium catena]|uniref:Uncharacterized protein n=1 Tax=Salinimicrobium catena TaxID=390640 RepID=A0A1H5PGZ2_9FLAO|nr:hypothetical protein [Salinimicrobium catena]SDL84495.1 hypothetical protein SAMN04488140_11713 [Salinimicrobium catena]SEF12996.1 hypothetical protein SAMN04488034_11713 [Salinimicrobium catena]